MAGWLSDYYIVKGERSRGGEWLPEDRLKAVIPGALVITPISVLGYGLTTEYLRTNFGVLLDAFWLFLNGVAVCAPLQVSPSGCGTDPFVVGFECDRPL
jgi:hypothetical protein